MVENCAECVQAAPRDHHLILPELLVCSGGSTSIRNGFLWSRAACSTSRTLLLLFQSKCVGLWGNETIIFTFVFCFAFRIRCYSRKKKSVQLFWLNCFPENFMSVGLNKQISKATLKKCIIAGCLGFSEKAHGFPNCRSRKIFWPATWKEKLYSCVDIMRNSYVMKNMCVFFIFSNN